MEPTIIAAVITGFATLFSGFIGFVKKKYKVLIITTFLFICTVFLITYKPSIIDDGKPTVIINVGNGNTIENGNTVVSNNVVSNLTTNAEKIATTPPTPVTPPSPTLTVPAKTPSPEPHEMLSKYPDPPSDDLIDIYGPGLHYPEKTEYLSECRTMYVDAPKGYSIYAYSSHRKDKKQIYEVYDGEEVTVLAVNKNNGFSCVIIESMQKAAWVNSAYLLSSPN